MAGAAITKRSVVRRPLPTVLCAIAFAIAASGCVSAPMPTAVPSTPVPVGCLRIEGESIYSLEWGGERWLAVQTAVPIPGQMDSHWRLWSIDVTTGERTQVLTTEDDIGAPVVAADGEVFWSQRHDGDAVWHASAGDSPSVLFEQEDVIGLWMTELGLAYAWVDPDGVAHFELRRDDGSVQELHQGPWNGQGAAVSRDGRLVVIETRDSQTRMDQYTVYEAGEARALPQLAPIGIIQGFTAGLDAVVVVRTTPDTADFVALTRVPLDGTAAADVQLPAGIGEVGPVAISAGNQMAWTSMLFPADTVCISAGREFGL